MRNKEQLSTYFADTALIPELKRLMSLGIFTGITTNPKIIAEQAKGSDPRDYIRKIANMFPDVPVSVQLLKGELSDLVDAAINTAAIAPNIVIKIPAYSDLQGAAGTEDGKGLKIISELRGKGIKKNVTALMTAEQAICYIMAGKRAGQEIEFASLFFRRIIDGGGEPKREIANTREFIDKYGLSTQIIVGSIRAKEDIREAQISGAHIVTIPSDVFWSVVSHPQSKRFIDEAQQIYEQAFKDLQ